jgi:hypothetical protein
MSLFLLVQNYGEFTWVSVDTACKRVPTIEASTIPAHLKLEQDGQAIASMEVFRHEDH